VNPPLPGARIFSIHSVKLDEDDSQGQLEHDVKRTRELNHSIPLHDYSPALQSAVSWLGDRHLLAEPVPRLSAERTPYFAEPRRWHPAVIAGALAKNAR
jgi:hypothetical protein